ncbi:hypothetical protein D3C84_783520 [compost metagenome]
MFRTSLKKITNVYYSIEASLRKLLSGVVKKPTLQNQIESVILKHTVDGVVHTDVRYCMDLARLVDPTQLKRYTPLLGLSINVGVINPTVHSLLLLLNECSRIVHDKGLVPERIQKSRNLPGNVRAVKLDDYLSTDKGHQLEPMEVYNAINLQLEYLQKALLFESADSKSGVDYYTRQFTHLMGDVEAVVKAFLEVQTYAKQGTQSGTQLQNQKI